MAAFLNSGFRWLLAVGLTAHAVAHLPGFAVAWRFMSSPELPYHTTLFSGRLDAGEAGMRLVGLLWMAAAVAFVVSAVLVVRQDPHALVVVGVSALFSLVLCAAEWPLARIGLLVDVLAIVSLPFVGSLLWNGDTTAAEAGLTPPSAYSVPFRPGVDLPLPVSRFFDRALVQRRGVIRDVTLRQEAEFFLAGTWRPLQATQRFTVAPAGFVWDARIAMLPLMSVFVRDAYVQGSGSMRADFLAVYPIVDDGGRPELDAGALLRYLAEAVWFPTALLPSSGVKWEPIDDRRARATLVDGRTTATAEFRFSDAGDVQEISAMRFAETNGRYELRPWVVRCHDHDTIDGVRIPTRCEVAWVTPSGPQPYWRGRVRDVVYTWRASA